MPKSLDASSREPARFRPIWVALGFPVLLSAREATPIAPDFLYVILGIPVLLLVWAGIGVWTAILTVRLLLRSEWRQAGIAAVLPLVIVGVALRPISFIHFCRYAGDTIHFYVRYTS